MAAPSLDNFEMTAKLADLSNWLIQQGLENTPVNVWLEKFCFRLIDAGINVTRVNLAMRAHHPEIGAVAFRWKRDEESEQFEYNRTSNDEREEYMRSPLYHLMASPIPSSASGSMSPTRRSTSRSSRSCGRSATPTTTPPSATSCAPTRRPPRTR